VTSQQRECANDDIGAATTNLSQQAQRCHGVVRLK